MRQGRQSPRSLFLSGTPCIKECHRRRCVKIVTSEMSFLWCHEKAVSIKDVLVGEENLLVRTLPLSTVLRWKKYSNSFRNKMSLLSVSFEIRLGGVGYKNNLHTMQIILLSRYLPFHVPIRSDRGTWIRTDTAEDVGLLLNVNFSVSVNRWHQM